MESSGVHYDYLDECQARDSFKQMDTFRDVGYFCDVIISTEDGHDFRAHRLVLASASAYFRAMFLTDMKESHENRVLIKQIDSDSMRALVDFAYTSSIRINFANVEQILSSASLLQFLAVENACYEFLRNSISVNSCVGILGLAELHGCAELVDTAEHFIRANFASVVKLSEFDHLTLDQLARLFSSDKLNVPCESTVFAAAIRWVLHDAESRQEALAQLSQHIRFPLMSRKFLIDTVAQEGLVMESHTCRAYVLEALDYHLIPERRGKSKSPRTIPRERFTRSLYVLGGEEQHNVLKSVEYYDFYERKWRSIVPMMTARKYVGAAILDGQLYAVGGVDQEYSDLETAECYSASSSQWTSVTSMNSCKGALAVAVLEGWLYAAGGTHNGSALKCVERYDPTKHEWSHVTCMRLPRSHFGLATLQGRLFAIGGHCGISEMEHVECYEPMANKWTDVSSMNKARMDHAVVTYNDRIYVVGGSNSAGALDSIEKYNPDLNLWLIIRNTMDPRSGACTAAIFGGEAGSQELYIIGGHDNHHRDLSSVKKLNLKFADYSTFAAPSLNQARVFGGVASS